MDEEKEVLPPTPAADELAMDLEIWAAERETLRELVEAILENKRLAGMIVSGWLRRQGMVMVRTNESADNRG